MQGVPDLKPIEVVQDDDEEEEKINESKED